MTDNAQAPATSAEANRPGMRGEILQKWPKFTEREVAALKSKDDLIGLVQSRYQLDKTQALKDVDAFADGRPL